METAIMKDMGIEYDAPETCSRKGCIARLCVKRRTEMINNWNSIAKSTHGKFCHVTRPPEMINEGNRKYRRRSGHYYFSNESNSKEDENKEVQILKRELVSIYYIHQIALDIV